MEASTERSTSYSVRSATARDDLDILTTTFSGKYYFGDARVQPYIAAGLGWAWTNTRSPDLDDRAPFARGGIGLDFYITSSLALFAEANYNRMMGDLRGLDHVNVVAGLLFRF